MYDYGQLGQWQGAPPPALLQSYAKRRRSRGLGAAAAAVAVPAGDISAASYCGSKCSGVYGGSSLQQQIQDAIAARQLAWPMLSPYGTCGSTTSSTGAKVAAVGATAAGAAVGITGAAVTSGLIAASAATAAIPIAGAVIAPILAIIGTIFADHAKAVQLQTNVLCENIPAANSALQQIQAGVANGSITPAQAATAYAQLSSEFTAAMKSDPSYKTGDALWLYDVMMQAVCAQCTQDLASEPGGSAAIASASGPPSWALLLGLGALAYFLL